MKLIKTILVLCASALPLLGQTKISQYPATTTFSNGMEMLLALPGVTNYTLNSNNFAAQISSIAANVTNNLLVELSTSNGSALTGINPSALTGTGTVPLAAMDPAMVTNNHTGLESFFVGYQSGQNAVNANYANIFGYRAGQNAVYAQYSNIFGYGAGQNATNNFFSNIFGRLAGMNANKAQNANIFGSTAGYNATNAYNANIFGFSAGYYAGNASGANIFGANAGYNAMNATNANFFGYYSGYSATNAARSIFIGPYSGTNRADTIWIDTKATVADGSYIPLILGYCDLRMLMINGILSTATNATIASGQAGKSVQSCVDGTNYWVNDVGGTYVTNHVP